MGANLEELLEKKISYLSLLEEDGNNITAKDGDLKSFHPEMSECPYVEAKDGAWNQVQPHKYLPVIGHHKKKTYILLCRPEYIIERVVDNKGQHTSNSMECANLSKPSSTNWGKDYVVEEDCLEESLLDTYAISHSKENEAIREFAFNCRKNIDVLIENQRKAYKLINDSK